MTMSRVPMNVRVRTYIDMRDVSRKRVALNMGVSESKLSLMLSGKRRMTVDDYEALCNAMAVDPKLFYETGESVAPDSTQPA